MPAASTQNGWYCGAVVLDELEVEREGYMAPLGRCARPQWNRNGSRLGTMAYRPRRPGALPGLGTAAAAAEGVVGEGRDDNDLCPMRIIGEWIVISMQRWLCKQAGWAIHVLG